jgi:hypothetical protein
MTADHVRWDELAVGQAFHALEPADEELFLTHLAHCSSCAKTMAETAGLMGQLAYAAESETPPESLRSAILDGVRRSDRPAVFPADPIPASPRERRRVIDVRSPVQAAGRPRRARWSVPSIPWSRRTGAPWAAVAAGLVLVLSLGLWNLVLHADNHAKDLQASKRDAVIRLMEDPKTRTVNLVTPAGETPKATAMINGNHVWLLVDGLARNDVATTTYVLWRDPGLANPEPIATFSVVRSGLQIVDAGAMRPGDMQMHALAVTLEKGRTAPKQPSTPIATGLVAT